MVLYKDYQEAIDYVDWHLLKLQQVTLENLLQKIPPDTNILGISNYNLGVLWGLIGFIKNLQDVHENDMLIKNRQPNLVSWPMISLSRELGRRSNKQ